MPNAWIFQSNAARLDVDAYLTEHSTVVWGCGVYTKWIEVGDRAFLWRASGGTKVSAGIVALATVVGEAKHQRHPAPELCRDERMPLAKLRVTLRVNEIRIEAPIPRAAVKTHPVMTRHPVVTVNQGCTFAVTAEQVVALDELWAEFAP